MLSFNTEALVLFNEYQKNYHNTTNFEYECEKTVNRREKIAFIDALTEGALTYIIDTINKFKEESSTLKTDAAGKIKTTSLLGWLKRNDNRKMFSNTYYLGGGYGKFSLFGSGGFISDYDKRNTLIDKVFHTALDAQREKEEEYFIAHDKYMVLTIKCIEESMKHNTYFGLPLNVCCPSRTIDRRIECNDRKLTMEELEYLSDKYDELQQCIDKITKEVTEEETMVFCKE